MMPARLLLLSIHPEHADKIFAGEKTVEFRRRPPRVVEGEWVLVYVSSPRKALVGAFQVQGLLEDAPGRLWQRTESRAEISRERFDTYYAGASVAYGILIAKAITFAPALPLSKIRERLPGFHPPQSYRYMTDDEIDTLPVGGQLGRPTAVTGPSADACATLSRGRP